MVEPHTLVVGVGSELRRDDAVGRVVVDRIDRLGWSGVRVEAVTQLVPELVESMARVDRVVFVDADVECHEPVVRAVGTAIEGPFTHHGTPEGLMALARTVGLRVPEVYVVGVPPTDLTLGTGLSPQCEALVGDVVALVQRLATG